MAWLRFWNTSSMIGSISLAMAPVVAAAMAIQNRAWTSNQRCGLRYVATSRFNSGMVAVWRVVGLSKELDTEVDGMIFMRR